MNSAKAPGRFTPTPDGGGAEMPSAGEAVAAAAADDVAFAADDVAGMKVVDVGADLDDLADKLVADRHGHGDGALRPLVPVVDMDVGAADAGVADADENVVDADGGLGNILEPQTGFCACLYKSLHLRPPLRDGSFSHSFQRDWMRKDAELLRSSSPCLPCATVELLLFMNLFTDWTRRRFLSRSSAAAVFAASPWQSLLGQGHHARRVRSAGDSPEVISGGIQPLLESNTARPLRYTPDRGDFLIVNGKEFFNRPLYGPNNAFRVDAGDLPEFSLYLPGHGGNLRLGIVSGDASKWLFQADKVATRYRPGRMIYEIEDRLLGSGSLHIELITQGEGSGVHLVVTPRSISSGIALTWAFGGVSGRKGRRNGDIGCEVEPVSQFFQLRPEECAGNSYKIEGATAELTSRAAQLQLGFPAASKLECRRRLALGRGLADSSGFKRRSIPRSHWVGRSWLGGASI